ncbi:phospholipase D-like domain-containing protein [Hydrogenophaga sp.]|uniref:phospholipase D-like domain-containing protein n=1 Tax=Hydrogenophaga sp. TaxID=1904254 RepID=UPI00272836D9|nr:phospholipase D-like domain-containing protein [Hydrogenophaga sp.]MDO9438857.1 phospholipase D-like domain-containing protein [Hydrogenophaga sp.]
MIPDPLPSHWLTMHGLVVSVALLVYVFNTHVLRQRRPPASAIAWVLFIVLLPYVALPAFLLLGARKLARPSTIAPAVARPLADDGHWAAATIVSLRQPAPAAYRALQLHRDGQHALEALMRTIEGAQSTLDLCTFILGRDGPGQMVVDRLVAKAEQGVRVRLMLDGMGSLMQRPPKLVSLMRAGAEFARFVPPLHSPIRGRTNLRDHRKMLIADAGLPSAHLWCGGRNLAPEYFMGSPGQAPWRDLSFDLGGAFVQQASDLFEHDWSFARGIPVPPRTMHESDNAGPAHSADGAQLVASGPDQADDTVLALLLTAAYRARARIVLATPYFVPDAALLMALCLAARRGVAVDLLVPARSNHRLSDVARGRALRLLALAGGRIWLAPGMMHAKLAVFDDTMALSGSANLDSRSLFLNYELMCAFHRAPDVQRFSDWFEQECTTAQPYVAKAPGLVRDIAEGMLLWLGFQL